MSRVWLAGIAMIGAGAIFSFGPTPRVWHRRIIQFRAALMTIEDAWYAGVAHAKRVWPEMQHKAKSDV